MTFYEDIRTSYGQHTVTLLKEVSKLYTKLATQKNRRVFLLRCKHMEIYPTFLNLNLKHLEFKDTYLDNKLNHILNKTKKSILNLSLKQTTTNIIKINNLLQEKQKNIERLLPIRIATKFLNFENKKFQTLHNKIKLKQQKKIENLTAINPPEKANDTPLNWIENISDTVIPKEITKVLSYGPNFALDITKEKDLPIVDYIASIESAIKDKPPIDKDSIRAEITNVITNHKIKLKQKNIRSNRIQNTIKKHINQTKRFIKENPQITILQSDKSNKTVVMNTTEYEEKMQNLLKETTTYKKLNSDPTNIFQKKNNSLIKKILNAKEINELEAKRLTINNAVSPKIYGLPKLHKQGNPLRPIVSCIQSPMYNLSKFLAKQLTHITGKNEHFIQDSFTFKEFIDKIKIPPNYTLMSLDVTSLYTNIPKELVITVLNKKWHIIQEHTSISKKNFIEAIDLTLNTNYFQFKEEFYKQIDGCAMGSPISSVIAQLTMEFLEEQVIKNLKCNILFFKRFVDDCILAVPETDINDILTAFNNFHPKLQFTMETEKNKQINFLDMTLIKQQNKIVTKWYTKPTWSGRYLNFNSNHATPHKLSVITGLTDRAIKLTSPQLRPTALKKVKTVLLQNNFKETDINKTIQRRTYKHYNNSNNTNKEEEKKHEQFLSLPYTKDLSEKLKSILMKYNITVCHKAQNKLNSIFTKLKSKVPTMSQSNVVYAIPCTKCPKKYIGMTCQLLKNRLNGHKYTKNASTALSKHVTELNHDFNFNETKIIHKDNNYNKLTIKEMIAIRGDEEVVNDRADIKGISHIYTNLLIKNK